MADPNAEQHGSDITHYSEVAETQGGSSVTALPFAGRGFGIATAIFNDTDGDTSVQDAAGDIGTQVALLGVDATLSLLDPIGALASAGVTIVLDLVQPLDDLLLWVTGDNGEMQRQIDVLAQVQTALEAMNQEVQDAIDSNLTAWEGQAATAAIDEIGGVSAAAHAIGKGAGDLAQLLDWARLIAVAIYSIIKGILSELVAWLITRGVAALAASIVSAGASVAAFLVSAAVKAIRNLLKATRKFAIAQNIFRKLIVVLRKIKVADRASMTMWKELLKKVGTSLIPAALTNIPTLISPLTGAATPNTGFLHEGVGSSGSLQVEVDELAALASALDALAPNADAIGGVAAEAGAAEMTWGVTGLFFEQPYLDGCAALVESVSDLAAALRNEAENLRSCADSYSQADEEIAAELEQLVAELNA
ncbi:type VII secretion target [Glycomyces sp. NPDC021274]|uniref:type VII secretion target n=1 Tax=Glycomyces sp. NPDC021274 TaxID=3155120 RepID=UPI0034081D04